MHQISDFACQIDTWSWSQIIISIQLIMFVDASVVSWLWNIADSYNSLKFSQKTWILQVLIIIVQNIILLQAVSYCRSCNLIQQHSVFMKRNQLSITYHFCCIARAYLSECDQTNWLQEDIQDQNQNVQVSIQLWIVSLNH